MIRRRKISRSIALGGTLAILLFAMAYMSLCPQRCLSIQDLSNGKKITERPVAPGDNVWIVFINSVEGLPVADHFVVNEDYQIIFTETIYQAPYAGYTQQERAKNIAPRTTRISGLAKSMEEVTFYAGYDSRHLLFVNGHWVPLYDAAKGGDLIQIRIRSDSRFGSLIGRIISHD